MKKVRSAVELIDSLKAENRSLKSRLDEYRQRVEQLESTVNGFKHDQQEIEEGIKDVLLQLDRLEDQITSPVPEQIENNSADRSINTVSEGAPVLPASQDNETGGSVNPELEIF